MNSNITFCNDRIQCYYSYLIFNFALLFTCSVVTYYINKSLKKEHCIIIIIHSITNIVNIVSYNYTNNIQNYCQYFVYIGIIVQFYLIVNQIMSYIKEQKIFISDISFEVHYIPIYYLLFIFLSFPINIFFNDEIVTSIQNVLLICLMVILFYSFYNTLQDILLFLNEKTTNSDNELPILIPNLTVLDIYKIYNTIKNSLFINYSMFIFSFMIVLMKKVVIIHLGYIINYSSFVLIETIPIIHYIAMSMIDYIIEISKEKQIELNNQEEDKGEIQIELSNN